MVYQDHEEVYEDFILPHFEDPYNKRLIQDPTYKHTARNPQCGDFVTLQLIMSEDGQFHKAYFDGDGCVISQAGASILCEHVEGKPVEEIEQFTAEDMLSLLRVPLTATRQRCGLLAFNVLKTILRSRDDH